MGVRDRYLPPPLRPLRSSRFPRTLTILTGCEITEASEMALRTSWPPPSPVVPSSSIGFFILGSCGIVGLSLSLMYSCSFLVLRSVVSSL